MWLSFTLNPDLLADLLLVSKALGLVGVSINTAKCHQNKASCALGMMD